MDQIAYKKQLLTSVGMLHCRSVPTPLIPNAVLSKPSTSLTATDLDARGNWDYDSISGQLNWLVTATCPQYAHSSSVLSQFNGNWRLEHKTAQIRVLRHMAGDLDSKLVYTRQQNILTGFLLSVVWDLV